MKKLAILAAVMMFSANAIAQAETKPESLVVPTVVASTSTQTVKGQYAGVPVQFYNPYRVDVYARKFDQVEALKYAVAPKLPEEADARVLVQLPDWAFVQWNHENWVICDPRWCNPAVIAKSNKKFDQQ
jgi:hypothetical protein